MRRACRGSGGWEVYCEGGAALRSPPGTARRQDSEGLFGDARQMTETTEMDRLANLLFAATALRGHPQSGEGSLHSTWRIPRFDIALYRAQTSLPATKVRTARPLSSQ